MLKKAFLPFAYAGVFIALKSFSYFENHITGFLPLIERTLGFEAVVKLLMVANPEAAVKILRFGGASVGKRLRLNSPLIIQNAGKGFANLVIGDNCHIGKDVMIDMAGKVAIGNNVTISMKSSIITHFDAGDSSLKSAYPRSTGKVSIGDNAYIGCGATLLQGVAIGAGSLVGAGAVVTEDIQAGKLAAGVPARVVKDIKDA